MAAPQLSNPTDSLPTSVPQPIVFFDGECVMCNGFVDILLTIDPEGAILIAPLQGQTAKQFLPPLPTDREAWSIYYQDERDLYDRSDAFLQVCKRLGGVWSVFTVIALIPRPIRDRIYRLIARNRYRLFGRRSSCRMPSETEQERFLP
ncbi:DCC1-like thiol-disulfide oxidoreductase family protein [Acaryochloris sp. IP29b_bin.137]|uniref:thiol-disulfide oxidoreductase DCC family protein n=1 Tax=Acaryochloris sp. IP29b_bin.137 TaxID=2969217 RepID=UPI00263599C0|nr:DCC1-like thiol-disulfide oxidoreductase family protein [Acaryochloris sp. IP29b_bin.137]